MEEKKKSAHARKAVLIATLGLACGAAVVMAVAARRPLPSLDPESLGIPQVGIVEPGSTVASTATETPAPMPAPSASTETAVAAKAPAMVKKPAAKTNVAKTPASAKSMLEESTVKPATIETYASVPAAAPEAAPARPAMTAIQTASVTINGCLERDGNSFRLKDIEGEDAPKTRSWKSGFLKRGKPKIDVVDATNNRLKLTEHVGHRVSLTGMLEDREMQAHSVSRVAAFCE